MSEVASAFYWPLRVYIEDTDAGGIVYYVNYLKFMERARTEFLRSLGFGKQTIFNAEAMFVVNSLNARYFKPARLDDELQVSARVIELGGASMVLQQCIYREDELLVEGEVQIACVDRQTMKPQRLPKAMREALRGSRQSHAEV